jgi:hypothetical protein
MRRLPSKSRNRSVFELYTGLWSSQASFSYVYRIELCHCAYNITIGYVDFGAKH